MVLTRPEAEAPDVQLHFVIGIVDNHARTSHLGHGYSLHVCLLRPKSRGTLRLASATMRDAPLIDPRFLSHEDDLETLVRGFKLVRRIFAQPAFAPFAPREVKPGPQFQSDEELARLAGDIATTIFNKARANDDFATLTLLAACRELGVAVTAYGVLSRGLLSGHWSKERSAGW